MTQPLDYWKQAISDAEKFAPPGDFPLISRPHQAQTLLLMAVAEGTRDLKLRTMLEAYITAEQISWRHAFNNGYTDELRKAIENLRDASADLIQSLEEDILLYAAE